MWLKFKYGSKIRRPPCRFFWHPLCNICKICLIWKLGCGPHDMDVSSVSSHSPYFSGLDIVYLSLSYIHFCLSFVCVLWFSWRFEIAYVRIMSKIGVVSFCTFEKVVWFITATVFCGRRYCLEKFLAPLGISRLASGGTSKYWNVIFEQA